MKIRRYFLFAFAAVTIAFTQGCDLEGSDNGDLDGMWQMESVDTLATGGHADMRYTGRIWSFQGKLAELRTAGVENNFKTYPFVCKFQLEGDQLQMGEFLLAYREEGDPKVEDVEQLKPYGINALTEQFQIVTINKGTMVLQSSLLRLNFRKY